MEAFKPKWVNSILNTIEVNSLRLGSLQIVQINDHNLRENYDTDEMVNVMVGGM